MAEDVAHGEDVAVGGKGQRDGFASLGDADERAAFERGAALVDMSGLLLLLCEGDPTAAFGQAVLAGPKLDVGSCAFEAVLLGDGFLASVPLAARTGDDELLVIDPTPRSGLLLSWLEFVSDVERDGVRPYGGLRLRAQGSAGGHNGLASVLGALGTLSVPRLRIGLGSGPGSMVSRVLGHLTAEEREFLPSVLDRVEEAVEAWLTMDVQKAMSKVNGPSAP